jgi:hypothetical protein
MGYAGLGGYKPARCGTQDRSWRTGSSCSWTQGQMARSFLGSARWRGRSGPTAGNWNAKARKEPRRHANQSARVTIRDGSIGSTRPPSTMPLRPRHRPFACLCGSLRAFAFKILCPPIDHRFRHTAPVRPSPNNARCPAKTRRWQNARQPSSRHSVSRDAAETPGSPPDIVFPPAIHRQYLRGHPPGLR